jgi:hypothetical protein
MDREYERQPTDRALKTIVLAMMTSGGQERGAHIQTHTKERTCLGLPDSGAQAHCGLPFPNCARDAFTTAPAKALVGDGKPISRNAMSETMQYGSHTLTKRRTRTPCRAHIDKGLWADTHTGCGRWVAITKWRNGPYTGGTTGSGCLGEVRRRQPTNLK